MSEQTAKLWATIAGLTDSAKDQQSQYKAFQEENDEFFYWHDKRNLVEVVDAICDQIFVRKNLEFTNCPKWMIRAANTEIQMCTRVAENWYGVGQRDIELAYEEVVKSNFTKFTKDFFLASKASTILLDDGIPNIISEVEGYYVLRSASDTNVGDKFYPNGKILKPFFYTPPDLSRLAV